MMSPGRLDSLSPCPRREEERGWGGRPAASGRLPMERYQLAKIVDWAGTFRSRKRMQKLIFLLQAAGCPLDVDYDLHRYGPYSQDVARLTDEMVREKLLSERRETHPYGEQYSYVLTEEASRQMSEYESGPRGSDPA